MFKINSNDGCSKLFRHQAECIAKNLSEIRYIIYNACISSSNLTNLEISQAVFILVCNQKIIIIIVGIISVSGCMGTRNPGFGNPQYGEEMGLRQEEQGFSSFFAKLLA